MKTDWVKILLAFMLGGMFGAMFLGILIFSGTTSTFMTDGHCDDIVRNESINSVNYGIEYVISSITKQSIQCQQIPINYSNYSYTLYPLECLQLNEDTQNG